MSFDRFIARMGIRAANIPKEVNRVKRLCALAVDSTVVMATPVDTGRARSNWLVSLGASIDTVIDPYDPLIPGIDPFKRGESGNAQGAISQGQDAIGKAVPEQTICITNNVDYIGKLNAGSSVQAPAMFVQQAIDAGLTAVAGARIDTGRGRENG